MAGTTLTSDANGNVTSATDALGAVTYTWDARNRLAGVSAPGLSASFLYDPLGRRMTKTINGVSTSFLYDGLNPVQEKAGATVTANILPGLGIDEYFTRTDSAGTRTIVPDAMGSTLALTDAAGTLITDYTYEPFGTTSVTGAPSTNTLQYTGRENDGTGLYYYRARYYSPRLQRFVSEDPIGLGGGDTNLYGYVRDSPVNLRDPLGLIAEGCQSNVQNSDILGGRKDFGNGGGMGEPEVLLVADLGKLQRCLDACEAGGRAIEKFCTSLRDPRARALCWANRWSAPACKGICYLLFAD